jgi:hypothetical protein
MANVAHSSLTGADLHEPKGAATATSGQVYVADGAGSGAWTAGDTLVSFTGMIADFATPTVPTGWSAMVRVIPVRLTQTSLLPRPSNSLVRGHPGRQSLPA